MDCPDLPMWRYAVGGALSALGIAFLALPAGVLLGWLCEKLARRLP
jgi:hypothetical protein